MSYSCVWHILYKFNMRKLFMGIVLDNIRQAALLAKAADDARANNKCCDEACEAKSVTEKVTPAAAMKAGFAELIQSVFEALVGTNDPSDLNKAINLASAKLSEHIMTNATAPKAPAAFDVEAVRAAADDAINAALKNIRYESTSEDHKTEKFVWYKVTSAGIINAFAYDKELLAGIKVGKAIRLWAKCDYGAYMLYMGALNAADDNVFVDCIKQQVKDGTIPEPLGRVIFIMDILRKKIDDMKDKAVAAAEAKATQNPPKKAKEKEAAPAAEAAQNSSKKNPAAPTGVDPVADAAAPVIEPEVVAQA